MYVDTQTEKRRAVCFRLPEQEFSLLEKLAKRDARSKSSYCLRAVRKAIAEQTRDGNN